MLNGKVAAWQLPCSWMSPLQHPQLQVNSYPLLAYCKLACGCRRMVIMHSDGSAPLFARHIASRHIQRMLTMSSDAWVAMQVVAAGPRDMRMYYYSYDADQQRYVVGLATSPDGFR